MEPRELVIQFVVIVVAFELYRIGSADKILKEHPVAGIIIRSMGIMAISFYIEAIRRGIPL